MTTNTMTVTVSDGDVTPDEFISKLNRFGILDGSTSGWAVGPLKTGALQAEWYTDYRDEAAIEFAQTFTMEHPGSTVRIHEDGYLTRGSLEGRAGRRVTVYTVGSLISEEEWVPMFVPVGTPDLLSKVEKALDWLNTEAADVEGDTVAASAGLRDAATELAAALRDKGHLLGDDHLRSGHMNG